MDNKVEQALSIIVHLGLPRAEQNERSALCLLALLNLASDRDWVDAEAPLVGITPIMDWVRQHYGKDYAPNTRETFRRQTIHQFMQAGVVQCNPDAPGRPVNSPHTVYQVTPEAIDLLCSYGTDDWHQNLTDYLFKSRTLASQYSRERARYRVPVRIEGNKEIDLSPGEHSELIRAIIEEFTSRFVPGSTLVYVGDTGNKWLHFDSDRLAALDVQVDSHGKMPDVVLYDAERGWLVVVEAVTSHGPVNNKRYVELTELFAGARAGVIYVTAFRSHAAMARYLGDIALQTQVWIAEVPSHLIHFGGERLLEPHEGR